MNPNLLRNRSGLLFAATVCCVISGAVALGLMPGLPTVAQAQSTAATPEGTDDTAAQADGQQEDVTNTDAQEPATDGDAAEAQQAATDGDEEQAEDAAPAADDAGDGEQAATAGDGEQAEDAAQAADDAGDAEQAATDGDGEQMDDGAQATAAGDEEEQMDAAAADGEEQADDTTAEADDTAKPPPAASAAPTTGTAPAPHQGAATGSGSPATRTSSSAAMTGMGGEIDWGRDYRAWARTTGFVSSAAHGNRLLVTYVTPPEAAKVYRGNAMLMRNNQPMGFQPFPAGTRIVAESFRKGAQGKPGQRGPLFFMRKDGGSGWRYAFTGPDFRLIGEGTTGRVAFCQACHSTVAERDAVFAIDR